MRIRVEEWLDETGRGDVTSALRTYICSCPAHVLLVPNAWSCGRICTRQVHGIMWYLNTPQPGIVE